MRGTAAMVRDALGVGIAVGAYGLSYGALSAAAGLGVWKTQMLSLLMYGGSSQLALVGVFASGGSGLAASATAALLGVRNLFYGLALAPVLRLRPSRVLPAAHLVSDESVAMALGAGARRAFWTTGLVVFVCWNAATLAGALGGSLLADPAALGLDAAPSAAFLAMVWPRLRERAHRLVLAAAGAGAAALTPLFSSGLPVVLAASAALIVLRPARAGQAKRRGTAEPARPRADAEPDLPGRDITAGTYDGAGGLR
ncbi:AzlC family ABC transporter permease [Frankia sp. AgKG'84/4]